MSILQKQWLICTSGFEIKLPKPVLVKSNSEVSGYCFSFLSNSSYQLPVNDRYHANLSIEILSGFGKKRLRVASFNLRELQENTEQSFSLAIFPVLEIPFLKMNGLLNYNGGVDQNLAKLIKDTFPHFLPKGWNTNLFEVLGLDWTSPGDTAEHDNSCNSVLAEEEDDDEERSRFELNGVQYIKDKDGYLRLNQSIVARRLNWFKDKVRKTMRNLTRQRGSYDKNPPSIQRET